MEPLKGTDLMCAPSITVLNGKTAELMMGQDLRYPSFDLSGKNKVHFDGTWSEKTIGVYAEVTPKVSEKGSLSVDLIIEVTEFEGFLSHEKLKNKGITITFTDNYEKTFPKISDRITPIFKTQQVESKDVLIKEGNVIHLAKPRREAKKTFDKTVASTLDPSPPSTNKEGNAAYADKHLVCIIELEKVLANPSS